MIATDTHLGIQRSIHADYNKKYYIRDSFTHKRVSPKPFWLETDPLPRHLRFEHFFE